MRYITVENLTKTFTVRKKREKGRLLREKTEVQALRGVSFSIERGELVGCWWAASAPTARANPPR